MFLDIEATYLAINSCLLSILLPLKNFARHSVGPYACLKNYATLLRFPSRMLFYPRHLTSCLRPEKRQRLCSLEGCCTFLLDH